MNTQFREALRLPGIDGQAERLIPYLDTLRKEPRYARAAEAFELCYGLAGEPPMTATRASERLGISVGRTTYLKRRMEIALSRTVRSAHNRRGRP